MIDLLLGAGLGLLAVRGWVRGLVREALEVATLLLGTIAALRLSGPLGPVVARTAGVSAETARLVAGAGAFLALSVVAGVAAHLAHRMIRRLPGLTLLNRLAGAALGLVYGLVLGTVLVTLLAVLPLPAAVGDEVATSRFAAALTRPDGPVQEALATVGGDHVAQGVLAIERLVGDRAVVLTRTPLVFPLPPTARVRPDAAAARTVLERLERERTMADVGTVAWSDELAVVAVARAEERYGSGGGAPADSRLDALGIPATVRAESVALAATPDGTMDAILASSPDRADVLGAAYRRVGVGVVSGPYGTMVVIVLTG